MMDLATLAWPVARASELSEAVARRAGVRLAGPGDLASRDFVPIVGHRAEARLREVAPAVLDVPDIGRFGLLDGRGRRMMIVAPDDTVVSIDISELVRWLVGRQPDALQAEELIAACGIPSGRQSKARAALLRAWSADRSLATACPLRDDAGDDFADELHRSGLMRRLATAAASHAAGYIVWIAGWAVLGRAALSGRLDGGWLAAWALLIATHVPLRWASAWSRGVFATGLGGLLKQRLFAGALRMDSEVARRQGAGGLLGRVVEADAVETLALNGGLTSALATIELLAALVVLAFGAGGAIEPVLLVGWTALAFALVWRYMRKRRAWTEQRLRLTHLLVENMTGHRTRIVQQHPDDWHAAEDAELSEYVDRSAALDRDAARLAASIPRGWGLLGLAGLAPMFLSQRGSLVPFAVGVGGVLLAQRALERLVGGATQLAGAWIAWGQVSPMFDAAAARPEPGYPASQNLDGETGAALDVRDVTFQYAGRNDAAVRGVTLAIQHGDRVLLEGDSGSGKSSLVGLLAGWRTPTSGSILARGYDRHLLGADGWRSQVVAAPQYHENHLVSAPLAFNLLMGRAWPPAAADLAEAERVCRGLGLRPLIDRMPGGLLQIVGESGWQLSQGERGRVFLARALLQRSRVVILDESFGALDPESTQVALEFCNEYAQTLVVVAHP
jgi:ATP-binding cassette subfamily B protein